MVRQAISQRLKVLEDAASKPESQIEVIRCLRQRLDNPDTPQHKRELIAAILEQNRPLTLAEGWQTGVITDQLEGFYNEC